MRTLIFATLILALSLFSIPSADAGCGACGQRMAPVAETSECHGGVCSVETEKSVKEPAHEHEKGESVITTQGLKALLSSGVPLTILDARSGKYDDGRRIPGAKSLNAESKISAILKILPEKEALIVTYCSNLKCPASGKLFERLKSLGYKNLIEYPEGIQGWIGAGHEVIPSR